MKLTLQILLVLMIMGCSQNSNQSESNAEPKKEEVTPTPLKDTFNFYSDDILTHIDAEELCEFNFDFFLPQLNHILEKKGLSLEVETTQDYFESNEIKINGHLLKLYSNKELENGIFWDKGPRNFFRKVNEDILGNNTEEKFYLLYGGNDLHTVFLTEEQFKSMRNINSDNENEIPYLP